MVRADQQRSAGLAPDPPILRTDLVDALDPIAQGETKDHHDNRDPERSQKAADLPLQHVPEGQSARRVHRILTL